GKHAIQSGESTFASFNRLPGPKIRGANWTTWSWLVLMSLKFLQVGGIIGGVAIIMNMIAPGSVAMWTVLIAPLVSLLVFRGYYQLIEKLSLIMIGLFTILTIVSVCALQSTEFAVSWGQIASGLTFQLPRESALILVAIGAFGITGVGGDEIMTYNYWLLEKGYAAKTGPRDDSEAWQRRAKGWIRVMYADAILSMVVYTIVTAAFYILGAAVLHAQGVVPEKGELVETLALMYTDTLGPWARNVFLLGAAVVLFSTLFAALAGWTRLYSDCLGHIGVYDFQDDKKRHWWIALLAWLIPAAWAMLYLLFKAPGMMVLVGGMVTSVILLIVVFAAFHFRYRRLPDSLRPNRFYDGCLWASGLVISATALYGLIMLFVK
ncbi:MAG: Nramp family divalent metal transporter, partial [Verrucomicrobiota bacterium]